MRQHNTRDLRTTIRPAQGHIRILVVDDEPVNLTVMAAALESLGYSLIYASDAAEAAEAARRGTPHLVLLDVMMPGESGIELCRRWRSDASMDQTPIVLVTALGAHSHRTAGLGAGADDFIEKPLEIEALISRVESWLAVGREAEVATPSLPDWGWSQRLLQLAAELAPDRPAQELAAAMARACGMHDLALDIQPGDGQDPDGRLGTTRVG
jgi:DNA-binding response OmpR family regulator